MRIGIDASRAFVQEPTGTERYAYELIIRILRLPEAKKNQWILYVRNNSPLRFPSLNLREGKGESYIKIVKIPLKFLWTQAGLAFRTWTDNLDCLWVPAHTLPVLRKPGIKTVVTIHGIEYEWLPAYENWLARWYLPLSTKYAVRSAEKIIAVSEFTKKQLMERLGAEERRIRVIYEGYIPQITNPKSQTTNKSQISIFKKYQIKPQQYLLFVGTIQPRKNLVKLIEAFAKLYTPLSDLPPKISPMARGFAVGGRRKERGIEGQLKLVICGKPGWSYNEVLAAPRKFGVEKSVIFTGYVNDTVRGILLYNALVYVQPSITEGFGLPVLEAMAAGVPVVSSAGGALAEVVGSGGLLFDPDDIREMADKMRSVIEDRDLRKDLKDKGAARMRDFSWDKAAKETYKILTTQS